MNLGLLRQRAPPVPGQPVIAAQPAVVRLLPVGLDQPLGGEPVQHPVQAADLQLDPALRQLGHLTHDAVPMPRAPGQRGEHEERLPRHRLASHAPNILETRILVEGPKLVPGGTHTLRAATATHPAVHNRQICNDSPTPGTPWRMGRFGRLKDGASGRPDWSPAVTMTRRMPRSLRACGGLGPGAVGCRPDGTWESPAYRQAIFGDGYGLLSFHAEMAAELIRIFDIAWIG